MDFQYTQLKEVNENLEDGESITLTNLNNSTVINIQDDNCSDDSFNNSKKEKKVGFFRQFLIKDVYKIAFYSYLSLLLMNIVYSVLFGSFMDKKNTNEEEIEKLGKEFPVIVTVYACLLAPIIEELIFRKLIFGLIKRWSKILAYIISSFIFAFGHFGFSFTLLLKEILFFPLYFFAGVILAYAYNYYGYILTSILTHILYNSSMMLLSFIIVE